MVLSKGQLLAAMVLAMEYGVTVPGAWTSGTSIPTESFQKLEKGHGSPSKSRGAGHSGQGP